MRGAPVDRAFMSHRRRVALGERRAGASRDRSAAPRSPRRAWPPAPCVRFQPTAPRFCFSCSSLRAPMTTVDTVGRCSSQLSAICGMVLPVSLATSSSASTTLNRYSSSTGGPALGRLVQAALLGDAGAAADLAGEAAPAERAPHDGADALLEAERHQLPFVVAADQRVVGLVGDVARVAVLVGDAERLHDVPAGEVRHADVADLAGAHERVERRQHFLRRRHGVVAVQLEEIDVVGAAGASAAHRRSRAGAGARSRRRWARRRSGTSPWSR